MASGKHYQVRNGALVDITPNVVPFMKYELCEVYYFLNPALRQGFVQAAGGLISNAATAYPAAFAYLQTSEGSALCVTEAQWQAMSTAIYYTNAEGVSEGWNGVGGVPKFVVDTANGTIRVPDLRGMYMEAAGLDGLAVGGVHHDTMRHISAVWQIAEANFSEGVTQIVYAGAQVTAYGCGVTEAGVSVPSFSRIPAVIDGNTVTNMHFQAYRQIPTASKTKPRAFGALACVYLGS